MKRETIQDEFRQMITRRLKARKRAKAAAIQPMVYARHAEGRASPIRKTPSRREGDRFSLLVALFASDGKRQKGQAPKSSFPKNEKFLILGN